MSLQGSQEVLPKKKQLPRPARFPIWSDLGGVWFTAQPPGHTFPSAQADLKLWRWKSPLASLIVRSVETQRVSAFIAAHFSCPVFLLPLLLGRCIGCTNFKPHENREVTLNYDDWGSL